MPRRMRGAELFELLEKRRPAKGEVLDRLIERRCVAEQAVLVSDSAGFTRRTHELGVIRALADVRRAYARLRPLIAKHKGEVICQKVDNLIAVFPDALQAVRAAVDVRRASKKEPVRICMGIDVGPVLRLEDDVFGAAVNVASKLGEDLAGRDEILVTGEVARRVKGKVRLGYSRTSEIGGLEFELYKVR